MNRKIFLLLSAFLLTIAAAGSARVFACSVSSEELGFCEMVGSADVIFVGKAVGAKRQQTTDENGVKTLWDGAEIYFEVEESFVGLKKGMRVTLRSGGSDGYCGTWFKHNEKYLVYAFGDTKKGFADGDRTKLIASAQEDLEALRKLPKPGSGSQIYGTIIQYAKSSLEADNRQPLSGLPLKIQRLGGKKDVFETATDAEGKYQIGGVPAGEYKVLPLLSNMVEFGTGVVEVKDRGCVRQDFSVRNKTKIGGRVVDAEGRPVSEIFVHLLPADLVGKPDSRDLREEDLTDDDGKFTIENVPPGRYTLSVNYLTSPDEDDPFPTTFYPNAPEMSQAMTFDIKLGSDSLENLEFRLPPRLVAHEIKGVVVFSDGTPVGDAHVGLRDAENNLYISDERADKFGSFTLRGFIGGKYFISADNYSSDNTEKSSYASTDQFILDENTKFFRLVLEKKE